MNMLSKYIHFRCTDSRDSTTSEITDKHLKHEIGEQIMKPNTIFGWKKRLVLFPLVNLRLERRVELGRLHRGKSYRIILQKLRDVVYSLQFVVLFFVSSHVELHG